MAPTRRGTEVRHGSTGTRGEGFAKWSGAAHKWTTLHALLLGRRPRPLGRRADHQHHHGGHAGLHETGHTAKKAGRSEVRRRRSGPTRRSPTGTSPTPTPRTASTPSTPRLTSAPPGPTSTCRRTPPSTRMNGVTLSEVKARIRAAMKRIGADVADSQQHRVPRRRRSTCRLLPPRGHPHRPQRRAAATGRLVEAYAAVFDDPAEIHDHAGPLHRGHRPGRVQPGPRPTPTRASRGGLPGPVKVLYNHGMTIQGTPRDRVQHADRRPRGHPRRVPRPAHPHPVQRRRRSPMRSWRTIRAGSITAQSFTGRIVRSAPELRRGDKYRPARDGQLTTVRRTELGLREYGPVPVARLHGRRDPRRPHVHSRRLT